MLAGTDVFGVYLSTNSGNNWVPTSLNFTTIWSVAINDNYVFAGGNGSGVVFAAAWLVTLMWALRRRQQPMASGVVQEQATPGHASTSQVSLRDFKRALDHEDLGRVADVLCALRTPPATNLDGVRVALDDAGQVAAVDALQRARWGDGDGVRARALLREAFRRGPRWKQPAKALVASPLPPLYPSD
jgi:hypothetical protein